MAILNLQRQPHKTKGIKRGKKMLSQKKTNLILNIYKSNSGGVCLSVWTVPGRFFQSLPVPCGAAPDVTDSREKRNQGQFDFLKQKIW
jgi:hypothetical protein